MTYRLFILFVFIALIVTAFKIDSPLREHIAGPNNNIDISITENKESIKLVASFPKNRSRGVQEYIKNFFGITDITDMDAVEVKQYHTQDGSMIFHLKSRNGYLKIAMNKAENTKEAVEKLRAAAEGVKQVLAGNSK